MQLENIVFDAVDPHRLGRFWEGLVGAEPLTDEPDLYETRLADGADGGPLLDLCFPRVAHPSTEAPRLHLDLAPGTAPAADPEGNPLHERGGSSYDGRGPLVAIRLASADPDRDADFWSWLTGWVRDDGAPGLRHPSGRGPRLELVPEAAPKGGAKNRIHLDVRLEAADDADAVGAAIAGCGGRELVPAGGAQSWRVYADPSGNELCVLRAPSS